MMQNWNPWHGCSKISTGCLNCYVYRGDARYGRDPTVCRKTLAFDLPVQKKRDGSYKLKSGDVFCCGSSDFFLDESDTWRADAWHFIRERPDIDFLIITKRIHRFRVSLPDDWGAGYDNVAIGCTCENQDMANYRMPIFLSLPIKYRYVICEPILEKIDLSPWLHSGKILKVVAGGESGSNARVCDYEWITFLRDQCDRYDIDFYFKQTGTYLKKDGRTYHIDRCLQHSQARKAGINYFSNMSKIRAL